MKESLRSKIYKIVYNPTLQDLLLVRWGKVDYNKFLTASVVETSR